MRNKKGERRIYYLCGMNWQKIFLFLFSLIGLSTVNAQIYSTRSWKENIKSVQIANYQRSPRYPVVDLESGEQITLTFDDLNSNATTYSYRVVHCSADWEKSTIQESEYMDGFFINYIDEVSTSSNTYFTYDHYRLTLPNDNWKFKISGNYAIEVFQDNDQERPVVTACFSVVDPKVNIHAQATARTNISYQKDFQQVNIDIDYSQYDIKDPLNEIWVEVTQNGRKDNRVLLSMADYIERQTLRYLNNPKLIFEAGNQYRVFDISSERILSDRIESIDYFKPYYHVTLFADEIRNNKQYDYIQDVHGRYMVNVQFSDYPDEEADYFFTHFSLPAEQPFWDSDVYIIGELTGNQLTPNGRMQYNAQKRQYEKTLLLKQGGYNYLYLVVPKQQAKGSLKPIEGNFWQTQNEYEIKVYHKPFGSKCDKLIGFTSITAGSSAY